MSSSFQKLLPLRIFDLGSMLGHLVEAVILQPCNLKAIVTHSVVHIVVLGAPAPEHVREAVDQLHLLPGHGGHPSEDGGVGHLVVEGGHLRGHVEGKLGGAVVHVGLVHWEEVDVMEDCARVVEILHSFSKANI